MKKILFFIFILLFLVLLRYVSFTGKTIGGNSTLPSFDIFYPKEGIKVSLPNITFLGKYENAFSINYKLNDEKEQLELLNNGFWIKTFNLTEGNNTILIYVCGGDTCSEIKTVLVPYYPIKINETFNQKINLSKENQPVNIITNIVNDSTIVNKINLGDKKENFLIKIFKWILGWK